MLIKHSGSSSPLSAWLALLILEAISLSRYASLEYIYVLETVHVFQVSAINGDGWLLGVGIWCRLIQHFCFADVYGKTKQFRCL